MASMDLSGQHLVAVTRASLMSLRAALLRSGDAEAALALQEAGYAGGDALFDAFRRWLATRTDIAAEELDLEAFEQRLSEFFRESGWGTDGASGTRSSAGSCGVFQSTAGLACIQVVGALSASIRAP